MVQLPEKPPSDWTLGLTGGQKEFVPDKQFREEVTEYNRRYLHWDELKYRIPSPERRKNVWAIMKLQREMQQETVAYPPIRLVYTIIPEIVKNLHAIDRSLIGNILTHNKTLRLNEPSWIINAFMEEAIASSILEGAATTRKVAKEMLRKGRKPRNVSEQMVANNYETMNYILEHKDEPLTPAFLLEIHRLVTKGTIRPDLVGQFRDNNDIVVANPSTRVIYHMPPDFHEILSMIEALCTFANDTGSADARHNDFIHPVIRAIILHFLIGYIHPFEDGNGRTARSIFYWYVVSRGYWLFEYMPISRIILRSKKKYSLAYLHSEYDDMDLTYFLLYNLTCIDEAHKDLQKYLEGKQAEQTATKAIVRKIPDISQREGDILRTMLEQREHYVTIREIMQQYNTVYETARTDLLHLADLGYLKKEKRGREFVFILNEESGLLDRNAENDIPKKSRSRKDLP